VHHNAFGLVLVVDNREKNFEFAAKHREEILIALGMLHFAENFFLKSIFPMAALIARSATPIFVTDSVFAVRPWKILDNINRFGRLRTDF
jgi:hypothetical protein